MRSANHGRAWSLQPYPAIHDEGSANHDRDQAVAVPSARRQSSADHGHDQS